MSPATHYFSEIASSDRRDRKSNVAYRRGGTIVLLALVMAAVSACCMLAVNSAYLEMAKTDLQTATDLSAQAAVWDLGESQSDVSANSTMIRYLSRNYVGRSRQLMHIRSFDSSALGLAPSGKYSAASDSSNHKNTLSYQTEYPNLFGGYSVPFPFLVEAQNRLTTTTSVARTDFDIVLCIDRSASMAWDLSDTPRRYPNGSTGLDNYFRPPDPGLSRWAAVREAVGYFLKSLSSKSNSSNFRVGMVTFSSEYRFGVFSSDRVSVDNSVSSDFDSIMASFKRIESRPIIGSTNIAAGLDQIEGCWTQGKSRQVTSRKVAVLLSDGLRTEGSDPEVSARNLFKNGWTLYTVSFSSQADIALLQRMASNCGGEHFHAIGKESLVEAFRGIGRALNRTIID